MTISQTALSQEAFEIISTKFKSEITYEQQFVAMTSLNQVVETFRGFKSRNFYYSDDNGRWIDFIVWTDKDSALQASEQVMSMSQATDVFALIDEQSTIFSHYQHMGGLQSKIMHW